MKHQLLLLWILAAFSILQAKEDKEDLGINVIKLADGIKLTCKDSKKSITGNGRNGTEVTLSYRDDNSGEYKCGEDEKIYVKFRTCDNCVELDTFSIVGLTVGDVVATVVVGVAVYLLASQARTGPVKPTKKRSDKVNLIPNEGPSDANYQPLRYQKGGKSEYDVLHKK